MDNSKLFYGLFLLSLVFLAFVGGSIATVAEVFPANFIRNAYRGANALLLKYESTSHPYWSDLWAPTRTSKRGVTVNDPKLAQNGLTLFTSGNGSVAYLLNMDGKLAHTWRRPYSTVWDDSSAVRRPVPDDQVYFRKAHVFPNGDLLAIYIGVGDTPWGYGMVRLDKDSNVLWKNLDHFHHDFDVAKDGRIYGLTNSFRQKPLKGVKHLKPPFLEDFLTVVSPHGKTLKKISLPEAFNKSKYRRLLWRIPYYTLEDPLHTNGVEYLGKQKARYLSKKIPEAKEGRVLLSFRELAGGSLAILDPETEKIVWALRGSWLSQHDPDILPNGDILLFDNRGNFGKGLRSRIVEVNPSTGGIVWSYTGTEKHPLVSRLRGAQQRLANGDTLITESNGGRLVEVTRGGKIDWEYVMPLRAFDQKSFTPVVSWGQRIAPDSFDTAFRKQLHTGKKAKELVRK